MKSVAAYVRMSTNHQRYSIENQLAEIGAYCAVNHLVLERVYSDAGRSGLTFEGRPGLTRLIEDAEIGNLPFEGVMVVDVSRWGRFQDVDEGAYYEYLLREAGAPVTYCAEPFDTLDGPISRVIKSFKRVMAAEYSRELSRRVRLAKRRQAARGARCGAGAGYGYRRASVDADGTLVRVLETGEWHTAQSGRSSLVKGPRREVAAVVRIFFLVVKERRTISAIVRMMMDEEWPAPPRSGWTRSIVGGIVRNEKYAGTAVYGRRRRATLGLDSFSEELDLIRVVKAHPAIVSQEIFKAAQIAQADRRTFAKEDFLPGLRKIFRTCGVVTGQLVDADPDLPSATTLWRLFGGMPQACLAAGIPIQTLGEKRRLLNRRK